MRGIENLRFHFLIAAVVFIALTLSAPVRAQHCESLFRKSTRKEPGPRQLAKSVILGTRTIPDLSVMLERHHFASAQVIVFSGEPRVGKTAAAAQGILPLLEMQGTSTGFITVEDFKKRTRNGSDVAALGTLLKELLRPRVLAIDNAVFDSLSFSAYKDLAWLVGARFQADRSTILILPGELDADASTAEVTDTDDKTNENEHSVVRTLFDFLETGRAASTSSLGFSIYQFVDRTPETPKQ